MCEEIWLFCFCRRVGICVAQKQMCQISGHGMESSCNVSLYLVVVVRISYNGPAVVVVSVCGASRW